MFVRFRDYGGFGKEVCGTLRVVHCSPLETANELACRESGIVRTERTLLLHDADEAQRFHLLVRTLEVRTFEVRGPPMRTSSCVLAV